ncbi:MAG: Flp family type IVb pilin [Dehalococcoidia bacterium]|nr:Flp family type IVb pilin [Dehalococcoidia bacterium]
MEVQEAMLSNMSEFVLRLVARFRSEAGQALTEYGLILALIAVVCMAAVGVIGLAISGFLGQIATALGG